MILSSIALGFVVALKVVSIVTSVFAFLCSIKFMVNGCCH